MTGRTPWLGCRVAPAGWWCSREGRHEGPCAAQPRWWNLAGRTVLLLRNRSARWWLLRHQRHAHRRLVGPVWSCSCGSVFTR